ncbi:MAG: T9SS type A sorting domain-containing protein, partial [candidate division Zixibacteria bacterium]
TLTLICVDSCGVADTCQTTVQVELNSAPTASCPDPDTVFVCDLVSEVCVDGFACDDSDGNYDYSTINGVPYAGGTFCFTPVEGLNTLTLICVDSCGVADTCQTFVQVELNSPPIPSCPVADTLFVCDLSDICVDGFACDDPDGNYDYSTINGVPYAGGTYCFTPVEGLNTLTLVCVDSCGVEVSCETTVMVMLNRDPEPTCPAPDTMFVCDLSEICVDGFSCYDPDGNHDFSTINGNPYVGGPYCFTPVAGANLLTLVCVDLCGAADTCQTIVQVEVNRKPEPTCPAPDTMFVCDLSNICLDGFACNDPDGNGESSSINGNPFAGGAYCFTPVVGLNNFTLTCVDSCGAIDSCETSLFVVLNSPPEAACPASDTLIIGTLDTTICINGLGCSDTDGNFDYSTINGSPFAGGQYCFTPVEGLNEIILECVDSCGAASACTTYIDIIVDENCPIFKIEKTHMTIQGQIESVDITLESGYIQMGGFEFLLSYDASALVFQTAVPGEAFFGPAPEGCEWEYFTYRSTGYCNNCVGSQCPTGQIRVVGIADPANGPYHPSCFLPDSLPATLFSLDFLVTNDRTMECQYAPIRFYWCDCTDNTISSSVGDTLYLDGSIYDFEGNLLWDEDDDDQFPDDARPQGLGAPDYCINPPPGKPSPKRCIDFINGGVDIACADEIDDRGDLNMNGISNEIGDVVMYINYFIYGMSAFLDIPGTQSIEGAIAASDVNADGLSLTVADLVYQIRIVVGDAAPYVKLDPVNVSHSFDNGVLSVDAEMGAALIVVEGDVSPGLLAANMEMKYAYDIEANHTRILIYSTDAGQTFAGDVVNGLAGDLLTLEMATYQGTPAKINLLPTAFVLHQNYPNPFNPTTSITFAVPIETDYELTIYNMLGQTVATFAGHAQPGIVRTDWEAGTYSSGVYFYKLTAGNFTDQKKMLLMK